MKRPRARKKDGKVVYVSLDVVRWHLDRKFRKDYLKVVSTDIFLDLGSKGGPRRRRLQEVAMFQPSTTGVKGTGKLAADDTLAFKELPGWRRFFLDQTYADGVSERAPGLLILRPSGDGWQFTLKDPKSCMMLKFVGRTFDEGMLLGEALLNAKDAPWENDPFEANKKRRGRSRGA